ncbi:MAG: hypothetical protein Q8876_07355 [Bacillota bacterium]|nr:hypothetical protein [Bacillota bacterium]
MKSITRTIPTTTIIACKASFKDGKLISEDLPAIIVPGVTVKQENALKEVEKVHGKVGSYVVKSVTTSEDVYEISVTDFFKYAKKIEPAGVPETPTK